MEIVSRWNSDKLLVFGKYTSIKEACEKNRADLGGANLGGADLGDAKNYSMSHDFAIEIIRRQPIKTFTDKEWAIIGQVYIHRLCYDTIKNKYGKRIIPIFKKMAKQEFREYLKYYKEL